MIIVQMMLICIVSRVCCIKDTAVLCHLITAAGGRGVSDLAMAEGDGGNNYSRFLNSKLGTGLNLYQAEIPIWSRVLCLFCRGARAQIALIIRGCTCTPIFNVDSAN